VGKRCCGYARMRRRSPLCKARFLRFMFHVTMIGSPSVEPVRIAVASVAAPRYSDSLKKAGKFVRKCGKRLVCLYSPSHVKRVCCENVRNNNGWCL